MRHTPRLVIHILLGGEAGLTEEGISSPGMFSNRGFALRAAIEGLYHLLWSGACPHIRTSEGICVYLCVSICYIYIYAESGACMLIWMASSVLHENGVIFRGHLPSPCIAWVTSWAQPCIADPTNYLDPLRSLVCKHLRPSTKIMGFAGPYGYTIRKMKTKEITVVALVWW